MVVAWGWGIGSSHEHKARGCASRAQHDAPEDARERKASLRSADIASHAYDSLPDVRLGERPFEIALARKMEAGDVNTSWFERHGSTPITEIPDRWPDWYRDLVQARLDAIDNERFVRLIEAPEFKRRWNLDEWEDLEQKALENWLKARHETARYIP